MSIDFSEHEVARIREVLQSTPGVSDESIEQQIIDIREGYLDVYGCASLLQHSHLETAPGEFKESLLDQFPTVDTSKLYTMSSANLLGYKKDFVCYDVYYRGTHNDPGITIGLDPCEGEVVEGGVLTTDITSIGLDRDQYVDFIVYYFEQFKDREFPPNMPIYKFEFLPVQMADGRTVKPLSCVADTEGPLYAGDLTFMERAQILAHAKSLPVVPGTETPKSKGMVTDLDYLRYVIDGLVDFDAPVEEHILNYYYAATLIRNEMDSEKAGAHAGVIEMQSEHGLVSTFDIDSSSVTVTACPPRFDL